MPPVISVIAEPAIVTLGAEAFTVPVPVISICAALSVIFAGSILIDDPPTVSVIDCAAVTSCLPAEIEVVWLPDETVSVWLPEVHRRRVVARAHLHRVVALDGDVLLALVDKVGLVPLLDLVGVVALLHRLVQVVVDGHRHVAGVLLLHPDGDHGVVLDLLEPVLLGLQADEFRVLLVLEDHLVEIVLAALLGRLGLEHDGLGHVGGQARRGRSRNRCRASRGRSDSSGRCARRRSAPRRRSGEYRRCRSPSAPRAASPGSSRTSSRPPRLRGPRRTAP